MDASVTEDRGILERAMKLVSFLRTSCPWDRRQTPRTLIKHLIEESHEVAAAIVTEDDRGLQGELGDLLLNLAFQLVIAEEDNRFDPHQVWKGLEEKMMNRHPHLFGLGEARSWEDVKASEATGESALDGVATSLPPLASSYLVQRRASAAGFDWDDASGALEKVREETEEVAQLVGNDPKRLEEELGDLLFSVVNLARLSGVDPGVALTGATAKFGRRFRGVEVEARRRGLPLPGTALDELDRIWDHVKEEEA